MEENRQPYKPNRRLLRFTGRLGMILVIVLWVLRGRFGISTPSMCILTGIALLNIVMQTVDRNAVEKNYENAAAVRRNREMMRNGGDIGGDIIPDRISLPDGIDDIL